MKREKITKSVSLLLMLVMMLGAFAGCYNNYRLKKFDIDVGDEITFGKYKDEEIEWEVITRHFLPEEGKVRVELLSKYALDCQPFNEDGESSWEDCSLRKWLNDDFYNEAFSKSEQKQIVDNTYFDYMGDARYLTDKVYLMSLLWYRMRTDEAVCEPTDYAEDQDIDMKDGNCRYWGRDILQVATNGQGGEIKWYPLVFSYDGSISAAIDQLHKEKAYTADNIGVRPVINVEYKAPFTQKDLDEGDYVTFGTYDEVPIEWIVVDKERDGVTLFSRYGLDDRRMDKDVQDKFEDTELYDWLNGDFKNDSFNSKEQKKLVAFGKDEYVTVPDFEEFKGYRHGNVSYELFASYTPAYFEKHEADDDNVLDRYWLRDIDNDKYTAYDFTMLRISALPGEEHSVRPVIKISF